MQSMLDTAGLPARDRFDFWREMLNQQIMPVAARRRAASEFTGTLHAADFGGVRMVVTMSRSVDVRRTPALIRRSDPDRFLLVLNFKDRHQMLQDRKAGVLGPGDMVLLHSSRTFHSEADPRQPDQVGAVVMLGPEALPIAAHRLGQLIAEPFSATDSVVALVSRCLYTLGTGRFEADDIGRLSTVATDLIALMLARRLELEEDLPGPTRAGALQARVRAYIAGRLGDPGLSPETIAAAHHVSVRTLHRTFQPSDTTVAGWVRSQRLERCRRDLADPAGTGRSVRSIALRWGFTDVAHFTRVFRSCYGCSPAAYRRQHTGKG